MKYKKPFTAQATCGLMSYSKERDLVRRARECFLKAQQHLTVLRWSRSLSLGLEPTRRAT